MRDQRWIGFALGGTLIRARREERLLLACSDEGVTRARIEIALQRIDRYFMQEEPEAWHRADESFCAAYARLLANRLGLNRPAADLADRVRPTDWVPFPDTEPALTRLADAGYHLALVTTWGPGVFPLLRSLGLAACFDVLAVSSELCRAKPSGERPARQPGRTLRRPDGWRRDGHQSASCAPANRGASRAANRLPP